MQTTQLRQLIAAAETKIANIKKDIDSEILKLRAAADKETARLEAYANALKGAAKLEGERSAATSTRRARKTSRIAKKLRSSKRTGRKVQAKSKANGSSRARSGAATTFRKGSLPDRVRVMVLKDKKPIHLSEVVKQLGGPKKASLQSIENRISALARKGASFVRTATRTYGLIELGHKPAK